MILLFTVEVPGCDPYREYLFNYLRDQPIWHSLRFWNAALFYALQKDKVPKVSSAQGKPVEEEKDALNEPLKQHSRSISESSLTSTSSSTENTNKSNETSKYKISAKKSHRSKSSTIGGDDNTCDVVEQKLQENMQAAFSHLG